MTVTATVIKSNVSGQTGSVPKDDPANPAAGRLPTKAPLYYSATVQGGDPSWPSLWSEVKSPLEGQPNRAVVQVLLETNENVSTCTWEIFNLPQASGAGQAGDPPLAVSAWQQATGKDVIRGKRSGRQLLALGSDDKYHPVPQYQDYPAPVWRRVQGPRVVVDFPVPSTDDTEFSFLIDLILPGKVAAAVANPVRVKRLADGTVAATTDGSEPGGGAPPAGPNKGAAAPGNTFPAEAQITASDATNAGKLAGLGFVANPQTAWATNEKITVGTFDFHWDSTAWAAGAADEPDTGDEDTVIIPPPPPPDAPTEANTKAEIVDWLRTAGIDVDDKAAKTMSKAELLDLVQDVLDTP